jgi:DNA-binding MarR family transcriptional regulator
MSTMELHAPRPSLGEPLHRVLDGLRPSLQRALTRSWPETPLSPSQARLLRVVRLCPGISPDRAAVELREDSTLAHELIGQLVALDLLDTRCPRDGSEVELRLTRRGRVRTVAWHDNQRDLLDRALDTLSVHERAAIALALPALEHLAVALGDS